MDDKQALFRDAPIRQAVRRMAVPSVISSLVLIAYNMADTFFIGQTQDPLQVAAVSLTNAVFVIYMALSQLLGIGGSTVISILLGRGEADRAKTVSAFCFYGSLALGVVIGALILLLMNPLLALLGSRESTDDFARSYLLYLALGGPFILLANTFGHAVRGEGASRASMIGGLLGTVVNIVLDPILILTLGMGTAGAAIATVLGNIAGCAYYIFYLTRKSRFMSLRVSDLRRCGPIAGFVLSVGVPAGTNSALMSVAGILLNNALIPYGEAAVAAMGVVNKVYLVVAFVHMGISNGVQPLLGYCSGAGNRSRFLGVLRHSAVLTVVCGSVLTAFYVLCSREIVSVFIDDPAVIAFGSPMLVAASLAGPILGLMFLSINAMQALNRPVPATLLSLCRQGLFFIPLLFLLDHAFGLSGINCTQTVSDYLTIILALVLLLRALRSALPAERRAD